MRALRVSAVDPRKRDKDNTRAACPLVVILRLENDRHTVSFLFGRLRILEEDTALRGYAS